MARVPLVTTADLPAEYQHLFEVDETNPDDITINAHRAMANQPALFDAWSTWAETLYDVVDDERTRELVILAVARSVECKYVWHQHVELAIEWGIRPEEIMAISTGDIDEFAAPEQALLSYVSRLVANTIDDETHATLADHYSSAEIVSIVFLASEYEQISTLIEALSVDLDDAFVGWHLEYR